MLFAVNAAAQTPIIGTTSGKCGEKITWSYDWGSKTLTLTGSGLMYNYEDENMSNITAPWDTEIIVDYPGEPLDVNMKDHIKVVEIAPEIENIGNYAFSGAKKLESINLEYIKTIGTGAFRGCEKLTISSLPTNTTIGDNAFNGCAKMADSESGIIYVGENLIQMYKSDININSVTVKAGITTIHKGAFKGKTNLTSITFADNSLTTIGDEAFSGCYNLTTLNIPNTVTTWGQNIFSGCTRLTNDGTYQKAGDHVIVKVVATEETDYTIPGNIIYIAENAFKDCNNMQKIYCYAEKAPTSATYQLGNSKSYILYVNDGCEDDFYTKWNVQLDRINTTKVAIGSSGYTTLTLIHSANVPTGTKAYTATINNGSIELTEVSQLEKGVGYIIWSTNGTSGTYNFNAAGEAVKETSENMMKGVLKNTTLNGDGSIYLLSLYKGVVGFRCLGDNTYNLPAGKAYLQSDNSSGSVERDFLNFGGDETDIEDTKEDEIINSRNNTTYNLAGQKLSAPQKGLNIVDGKLVLL